MFTFRLTDPESGEATTVKADSRDVLAWEKTSRDNESYVDLITGLSLRRMYRLAHIAARREGVVTGKLSDFEERFVLDVEHEEVRPTTGDPSTGT